MDKQHIINEIRQTAEKNGGVPLGVERFLAETGIHKKDWFGKYWARWGDALVEAGYEANKFQGSYEDELVIGKLVSLIRELGRYPVSGELRLRAKQDKTRQDKTRTFLAILSSVGSEKRPSLRKK